MNESFFSTSLFYAELKKRNTPIPWNIIVHHQIGSTSSDLMSRIETGAKEGTVVVARQQTAGRGRSGNYWHSTDTENLYISCALQIRGQIAERLPLVPLAAGVALMEALTGYTNDKDIGNINLKWPNDLLLDGKKVGGILCETPGISNDTAMAVIGLGLNLGTTIFPAELENIATNIRIEGQTKFIREELAAKWLSNLHAWCTRLEKGQKAALIHAWKKYGEPFGRRVKVGAIIGTTNDLNEHGRLLVRRENGEICSIPGGIVENLDI